MPLTLFVIWYTFLSILLSTSASQNERYSKTKRQMEYPTWDDKFVINVKPVSVKPWGDFIVPYRIASNYSENERRIILSSLRDVSSRSCIRFKVRWGEVKYLDFVKEGGCELFSPSSTGQQKISFDVSCFNRDTALEFILQPLGFRSDEIENFIYGTSLSCSSVNPQVHVN